MKTIKVDLGKRSYDVIIKENSLKNIHLYLKKIKSLPKRGVIISNRKVFSLYGYIKNILNKNGFKISHILIPDSENAKSLTSAESIYHKLLSWKLNRQSFLIALGGGITGDLTGYIAATYLRGIPFIQIPTSLLAQVDSSVGGKVAVNLSEGKNLIGSFYQPKLVLIDPDTLKTLPEKEFKNGMAEIIKYGLIRHKKFFTFLNQNALSIQNLESHALEKMIYYSVRNKAEVVIEDETEKGIRAILNFGHTFGHAVEKTWQYKKYSHGEAVAIGMMMAARLSLKKNFLSEKSFHEINEQLSRFGLKSSLKSNKSRDIFKNLFYDKKMTDAGLVLILINRIGHVFQTKSISKKELKIFIEEFVSAI